MMRTILLVDDDDGIRGALRAILEEHGLAVEEASDAADAIHKAETLKESLAVLVTDAVMPGMSGTELAHILRRKHLELSVVFMSGYAAGEQVHELFERAQFLQKPFSRAELLNAVCSGLEAYPNPSASKSLCEPESPLPPMWTSPRQNCSGDGRSQDVQIVGRLPDSALPRVVNWLQDMNHQGLNRRLRSSPKFNEAKS